MASREPHLITINSDLNDPTIPYACERKDPIIPPSLNDLNLPPNPFKILATMVVLPPTVRQCDKRDAPQSPEPSDPFPILTPPITISKNEGWVTPSDADSFHSDHETRRVNLLSTPSPPYREKRKLSMGECPFQEERECRSISAKPAWRRSLK